MQNMPAPERPMATMVFQLNSNEIRIVHPPFPDQTSVIQYRCTLPLHVYFIIIHDEGFVKNEFHHLSLLCHVETRIKNRLIFRIGVIAPYRAQANLIDKLLAAEKLPEGVDVQVGTIHGFQGDECDMIFAVFNTPPRISDSSEMFLNRRNIINVSISRARDYLFIVMPDDQTENIANLRLVKGVEELIKATDAWTESSSADIELMLFGSPDFLERNAFSTSHQSVNVYGLPEKRYEVRTEEDAVDVQIHRAAEYPLPPYEEGALE